MTIQGRILKRIHGRGRGAVFTPMDFLDLGGRDAVDQTLSRLFRNGTIRRLDRGVYDFPALSKRVGYRSPNQNMVVRSVSARLGARVQRSGAYVANALGLSDHVPARAIFLTDGPNRTIRAGNRDIILRHAGPRNMIGAGSITGDVYQALRFIGKDGINGRIIRILKERLSDNDKHRLSKDAPLLPGWMQSTIQEIMTSGSRGIDRE